LTFRNFYVIFRSQSGAPKILRPRADVPPFSPSYITAGTHKVSVNTCECIDLCPDGELTRKNM